MPTYAYRCKCGDYFEERFKKMAERETHTCPSCGETVKNVPVASGMFRFKGWWPGEQIKKDNITNEFKQKDLDRHGYSVPEVPFE